MTDSIVSKLQQIKDDMDRGKYFESVEILEDMLEKEELTHEERIRIELLLCNTYFMIVQWRYQIIFPDREYADKWLEKMDYLSTEIPKLNNLELSFEYLSLEFFSIFVTAENERLESIFNEMKNVYEEIKKSDPELAKMKEGIYQMFSGYFSHMHSFSGAAIAENYIEEAREHFRIALESKEQSDDPLMVEFGCYNALFLFFRNEGKIEDSNQMVDKAIELIDRFGNDFAKAHFYGYYYGIYQALGQQTKMLEYLLKRKELWDKLDLKGRESAHEISMGQYYSYIGETDKALESMKKGLEYYKHINAEVELSFLYMNIGDLHLVKGDLIEAEKYIHKAYVFLTENKYEYWWNILGPMARVYLLKGNLKKAKEIYEEELAFHENRQSKMHILFILRDISLVLLQMGKKEEALEYAKRSYEIVSETESLMWKGYILANLIYILVENEELEEAEEKLEELEYIKAESNDKDLNKSYDFCEAIILKGRDNDKDLLKAEIILERLLKDKLDYEGQIRVLTTLAELKFKQLSKTNDKEILAQIKGYVLDLLSLASSNQSFLLISESLLLQSKLALLELDADKSKQLLDKAEKIAKEKGLDRISNIIKKERSKINEDLNQIRNVDDQLDFSRKMNILNINSRVNGIKKVGTTTERTQESEFSMKLMSIKI